MCKSRYGTIRTAMKSTEVQVLPAPPNLIKAILSGFDTIANNIGLIIFPVALDVFLWLGPHLSIKGLLENAIQQITSLPGLVNPETADMIQLSRDYWLVAAARVNLFTALRSYPVGIPSLMASRQPVVTPYGLPAFWEVSSLGAAALIWLLLFVSWFVAGYLVLHHRRACYSGRAPRLAPYLFYLASGSRAGNPAGAVLAGGADSHQYPCQLCAHPGCLWRARRQHVGHPVILWPGAVGDVPSGLLAPRHPGGQAADVAFCAPQCPVDALYPAHHRFALYYPARSSVKGWISCGVFPPSHPGSPCWHWPGMPSLSPAFWRLASFTIEMLIAGCSASSSRHSFLRLLSLHRRRSPYTRPARLILEG